MTTAIGYTRLSQDSDVSIPRQQTHIREVASDLGFELDGILDDGQRASGFAPEELDAYQQLRERIRRGDIDAVITNDKRRLSRDENEVMRLVADLREQSIELHTYQDGEVDLDEPMAAGFEILRASVAAEEKREEIEKAKEAVRERVKDPDIDHGRPRFGMEYDERGEQQVPGDQFETVREIFRHRDRGLSFADISDEVGVSESTVWRICERREWYEARA